MEHKEIFTEIEIRMEKLKVVSKEMNLMEDWRFADRVLKDLKAEIENARH